MEEIIREQKVDIAVFSYSDVKHETLMHLASRVVAAGADFWLLSAERTQLKSSGTGDLRLRGPHRLRQEPGFAAHCQRVAAALGWHPVVIRHPMPYGDSPRSAAQRFATLADLDRYECTIEEREEYEPHIIEGTTVYAGVDYYDIMKMAEQRRRHYPVGRRQQRHIVLPARPGHRCARSASPGTRTRLLPWRSQFPHRTRAHH